MTTKRNWILQEYVCHGSQVTCASLGRKSGQVMATGGEDGKVNMWHVGSPNCILSLSPLSSSIEVVHFNASEELVCAGSISGSMRIWDLSAEKVLRHFTGHKAAVRSITFHPYGDYFASCSDDHSLKMWDLRRKGPIFTYKDHVDSVNCVKFSPDGRWIASCSADKTCKIWDVTAGKLVQEFKDHRGSVTCMHFHPCEKLLATGSADRTCKVYDVEQHKEILCTGLESNTILQVIVSETDKQIFTVSQDCCKVYSRDPFSHLDTELVKWGKPTDAIISNNKLIGCSFVQNVVSVHVVDLKNFPRPGNEKNEPLPPNNKTSNEKTKGSITSRVDKPKPVFAAVEKRPNVTTRPHTSCGVNTGLAANFNILPKEFQVNNNNSEILKVNQNDEKSIFNPKSTLARSPIKENESDKRKGVLPPQEIRKQQAPANIAPSQNSAISKKLTNNSQVSDRVIEPNINRLIIHQDTPPSPIQLSPSPVPEKIENKVVTNVARKEVQKSRQPLGGALDWNEPKQIPTRDCDSETTEKVISPPTVAKMPPEQSKKAESTMGLATVVPEDRQDPIGLDMRAFLPVKHEPPPSASVSKSDADAIHEIRKGLGSMRTILTNRHKNLEIVRALWSTGNVMTSINQAIKMEDLALIVDILGVLNLKSSLWSLDLCVVMLPQMKSLITSKYESYITVGCSSLKLLLKNFGQVIRSNIVTPPSSGVDISREERHNKCKKCNKNLTEIRKILESKHQTSGKVGSQFREIKILLSTVE